MIQVATTDVRADDVGIWIVSMVAAQFDHLDRHPPVAVPVRESDLGVAVSATRLDLDLDADGLHRIEARSSVEELHREMSLLFPDRDRGAQAVLLDVLAQLAQVVVRDAR